jgi:hypothetical protein
MKRLVFLVGAPFASAFVGTLLAVAVALPTIVQAQQTEMRADMWSLLGPEDKERVRLATGPGTAATVALLSSVDGVNRINMSTGAPPPASGATAATTGAAPLAAGFNLNGPTGLRLGRLGTVAANEAGEYTGVNITLHDQQARMRIQLLVDENGTPWIRFFDAEGNVTWEQG